MLIRRFSFLVLLTLLIPSASYAHKFVKPTVTVLQQGNQSRNLRSIKLIQKGDRSWVRFGRLGAQKPVTHELKIDANRQLMRMGNTTLEISVASRQPGSSARFEVKDAGYFVQMGGKSVTDTRTLNVSHYVIEGTPLKALGDFLRAKLTKPQKKSRYMGRGPNAEEYSRLKSANISPRHNGYYVLP